MTTKARLIFCAAIIAAMSPSIAAADDPNDPAMRNAAERARDREITRRLNQAESARVTRRDARYARGWHDKREYAARAREHELAMASYASSRAQYEREMAEWRHAVAACRAGDYSACDD